MRILFTGGTGKAGRHVVPYLQSKGHKILNVDLLPLNAPGVENRIADITDAGQMYDVLSSFTALDELDSGKGTVPFDAVVHFAAVPRIMITTDNECYRVNTMGTYNVIDTALKLGVRKIIFASSETTYGVCFAKGDRKPDYLPIDEEHPVLPEDSYAASKVVNEVTARSFQLRTGADIYGLRINNVIEPHEYEQNFPSYAENPDVRRRNIFSYIDARDLGEIVDRCLKTDGLGYQIFNASNDNHSVALTTSQLLSKYYEGVPVTKQMAEDETFFSNHRAKAMLGFQPAYNWHFDS